MKNALHHRRLILIPLLAAVTMVTAAATAGQSATQPPQPTPTPAYAPEYAIVTDVIDGDTIEVELDGEVYRVRYIGIDAPEHNQRCGPAATQVNADLLEDGAVTMVRDVSNTDRFGRLLRYVYIDDVFVNEALVEMGYAIARRYPPDTTQAELLEAAEVDARSEQAGCHALGVFDDTGQAGQSTRQPLSTPAVQPFSAGSEYTCDCSRTCRNMTCEEAYYQLNVCGCTERDGDGDGKPCESQCGH